MLVTVVVLGYLSKVVVTGAAGSVGTPSQDDPSLPSTWVSPIGRVGSDQGFIIH